MWHLASGSPLNKCLTNLRAKAVRDLSGLLVWAMSCSHVLWDLHTSDVLITPGEEMQVLDTWADPSEHTGTPTWCQHTFEKEALIGVPVSLKSLGQSFPKTLPAFWGHPCSQCCGSAPCACGVRMPKTSSKFHTAAARAPTATWWRQRLSPACSAERRSQLCPRPALPSVSLLNPHPPECPPPPPPVWIVSAVSRSVRFGPANRSGPRCATGFLD